ncbi:beta-1,4-mannosyl-glycoprotein 4-beta-N-acetylglucosaminyltransferase [Rhagoletis pomonella]|uniref:beta-1,4-mannosyl-glycoprotein 4-beta-N-acetylglucosaminyltransferase n=1 Tax=Rhagoletis pomonella TaxID=28610 RepID=UPI00178157A9|nr:beta-1,4-mannosyl-glycoprotein 4-beta-N-acetylglucosaminyltransferase [Rhagoletis pomonella]XP_036329331.1 beta-1,4-mannosyl-glycoprotein 4-beta-N-acetylglucosaminyltransferase [Rhagoletis pomonella]XP_036329332.1 beta-1,4-mannosyl-glycoprotein 4-beta-N-acetylglucosaminyltransferase [Rhagoletis pomonella]
MFQRSGGNASFRIATNHQFPPGTAASLIGIGMPEPQNPPTAAGRATFSKKLLLTLLVLVQVCFISCLWLLQAGGSIKTRINQITILNDGDTNVLAVMPRAAALHNIRRVNFITKTKAFGLANSAPHKSTILKYDIPPAVMGNGQSGKANNFRKDFYRKTIRLNKSIDLINKTGLVAEQDHEVFWCFREGSFDEYSTRPNGDTSQSDELFRGEEDTECKCRTGWHGRDCGQPEIIWRALLKAKSQVRLRKPSDTVDSNQLVYFLEGNFFNLDLLDLQISALTDIVDFFIIFVKQTHGNLKPLKHCLKEKLAASKYLLFLCDNQYLTKNGNCTTEKAYEYFRQQMGLKQLPLVVKPTDLLLYTNDRVLPSRQALQFLKYYATDVRSIPFRLKYAVYGFYWQHPEQTQLNGFVSSFVHVDKTSVNGRDPSKIMQRIVKESTQPPLFVIGDLNHFGGWLCKYCQQPEEIVAELHAESKFSSQVQFPNAVLNIDVAYLQKLIATGIYVDGKTQLLRIRRYSDKYYSPAIAEAEKAKYGNLLVNLYESFDDEIEYEARDY